MENELRCPPEADKYDLRIKNILLLSFPRKRESRKYVRAPIQ